MATVCGNFVAQDFYCKFCDYLAPKKYNYDKHLLTARHHKNATTATLATFGNSFVAKSGNFRCESCNKIYYDRTGLWKHNKKCINVQKTNNYSINEANNEIKALTNLVVDVVKQNQELTNKIVDIYKNNNQSTNIHNNYN